MTIQARYQPPLVIQRCIACLAHPVSLSCTVLLVINDHVFKWLFPSWITGKLSDFAGLFFFPYLLAIVIALVLGKRQTLWPMPGSILLTALTFAGIKTSSAINTLISQQLSTIFSMPVTIALDPTDLWAVLVLPGTWLLWIYQPASIQSDLRSKKTWLTLALASLATVATSPCMPVPEIARIVTSDSSFYTVSKFYYDDEYHAFQSLDGHIWQPVELDSLPSNIHAQLLAPAPPAAIHCHPSNPERCYRIPPNPRSIQISDDAGLSWRDDYRIPVERINYLAHLSNLPLSCTPDVDLFPRDLAVLPYDTGEIVLVAMGYQGALLRSPSGDWERVAVLESEPLPLKANELGEAFWILIYETLFLFLLLPFGWSVFHALGLHIVLSQFGGDTDLKAPILYAFRPFATAILLLAFGYLLDPRDSWLYYVLTASILLLLVVGPVVQGLRLLNQHDRGIAWAITGYSALTLVAIATSLLPLYAWAFGLIPWYALALVLALAWILFTSWFGWRKMKQSILKTILITGIPSLDEH